MSFINNISNINLNYVAKHVEWVSAIHVLFSIRTLNFCAYFLHSLFFVDSNVLIWILKNWWFQLHQTWIYVSIKSLTLPKLTMNNQQLYNVQCLWKRLFSFSSSFLQSFPTWCIMTEPQNVLKDVLKVLTNLSLDVLIN